MLRHAMRARLSEIFATKTRDEWVATFAESDACVTAVLGLEEAPQHSHLVARRTFLREAGGVQPAPAPRFSRTSPSLSTPPPTKPGQDTRDALAAWGVADIDRLVESGAAVQA